MHTDYHLHQMSHQREHGPDIVSIALSCRSSRELGSVLDADAAATRCPPPPVLEQACEPCPFCDDPTQNENCNGHGTCKDNQCECSDTWTGRTCGVDGALCASGVLDVNCAHLRRSLVISTACLATRALGAAASPCTDCAGVRTNAACKL